MIWPHPRDVILHARSSYFYDNMFIICLFSDIHSDFKTCFVWNQISADTRCIQVCFCMLVISFYFVNCVFISCKLPFSSHFTRI